MVDAKHREQADDTIDAPTEAIVGTSPRPSAPWVGPRFDPGTVFADRFEIRGLIGRGAMGSVWRAHDRMVGETVAIKVLHLGADTDVDRAIERFRREVRLARRISSPHVARTHDLGSHEGIHYLTMELVEGRSLARILEVERRLPPARAAAVGAQIADGLAAAHEAGVIHRDLKPDNVLVEAATGRVVVTDFGIARAVHDKDAAYRTGGGAVGTPLYMAPEQVAGAPVDARADIYALGLVLYEMLTGELPFWAETPLAAAVRRLYIDPRDPSEIVPMPAELRDLVLRCLARAPRDRFGDVATVARTLHQIAGTTPRSAAPPGAGSSPSRAPTASRTSSRTSSAAPFAPLLEGDRTLAVLPFAYQGPASQDWLAAGICDELVDVLARTRGLRVLGRGVGAKLEQDPAAFGVDLTVGGTVQVAGSRLRVAARLVEVASGTQVWSERFEADIEDLFVVQERMGQRIAEALRLGIHAFVHHAAMPRDLVELYLRARQAQRSLGATAPEEAVRMLEEIIAAAPDFVPAYAVHSLACVRAWLVPRLALTRDWRTVTEQSIARAVARAPDLAETHLARAQWSSELGRHREAVEAARTALAIAPTMPEAHQFLASLQLAAGRAKEGLQRLDLALALEPALPIATEERARWHGLYGDLAVFERTMSAWEHEPTTEAGRAHLLLRVGAYREQRALIERGIDLVSRVEHPAAPHLIRYGRIMLGEIPPGEGMEPALAMLQLPISDRFRSLVHQMVCEAWGRWGHVEPTLEHLRRAESVLVDLEWIDRCPMLACVRHTAEFAAVRRTVRDRCIDIWSG